MNDEPNDAVNTMMRKTVIVIGGLLDTIGAELYRLMMDLGIQEGYSFDDLREFNGADRTNCFGFYRSKGQYCGACKYYLSDGALDAVVVKTAGPFAGTWVFGAERVANSDEMGVLMKRDGKPVIEFDGLQGVSLIEAVIRSALTVTPEKQSIWRRILGT